MRGIQNYSHKFSDKAASILVEFVGDIIIHLLVKIVISCAIVEEPGHEASMSRMRGRALG